MFLSDVILNADDRGWARDYFVGMLLAKMEPYQRQEPAWAYDLVARVDDVSFTKHSYGLICSSLGIRMDLPRDLESIWARLWSSFRLLFSSKAWRKAVREAEGFTGVYYAEVSEGVENQLKVANVVSSPKGVLAFYATCKKCYDWRRKRTWQVVIPCKPNEADYLVVFARWDAERNEGYGVRNENPSLPYYARTYGTLDSSIYNQYADLGDEFDADALTCQAGVEVLVMKYDAENDRVEI